ncbi:MAG: YMGG-like glycine zipper-containing protein [Gemmatimonadaceae bacterium]
MRRRAMIMFAALATAAAGCHKDNPQNDALQNDLNLANQTNAARMDSISAAERGYASPAPVTTAPRSASTPRYSAPARRTTSSSSNGSVATSSAPAQRTTVQKNTKRDAAIGAAAGAILGATTSRNKVKGGVIGAAAGGILGGVIGNNVDIKKKKTP